MCRRRLWKPFSRYYFPRLNFGQHTVQINGEPRAILHTTRVRNHQVGKLRNHLQFLLIFFGETLEGFSVKAVLTISVVLFRVFKNVRMLCQKCVNVMSEMLQNKNGIKYQTPQCSILLIMTVILNFTTERGKWGKSSILL